MATLVIRIQLPDEVKDQLRALPDSLRLKIEEAARARGLDGLGFFVQLKAMLLLPKTNVTVDPVEQDILGEIWLNLKAFEEGALGLNGKRLDTLARLPDGEERGNEVRGDVRETRIRQFRQWAQSNDRNTPLLSDEAISRDTIYGDR